MRIVSLLAACLPIAACGSGATTAPTQAEAEVATGTAQKELAAPVPPSGDPAKNPDVSAVVAAVDTNRDGRMSHAEWTMAGAPESSFDSLDETHRGYVIKQDMDRRAAPPGIDLDGDGRLTLEEFKEFDRRSSAQRRPGARSAPGGSH